jgi:uncharacterized protein
MTFEWDKTKNSTNIRKHGIDFNDIPEIFNAPMIATLDDSVDYNENRYIGIGILRNILAVIIFVEKKDGEVIRIISARKANKYESKIYKEEIENRLG